MKPQDQLEAWWKVWFHKSWLLFMCYLWKRVDGVVSCENALWFHVVSMESWESDAITYYLCESKFQTFILTSVVSPQPSGTGLQLPFSWRLLWPRCHNLKETVLLRAPMKNPFANSLQASNVSSINPIRPKPMNRSYSQNARLDTMKTRHRFSPLGGAKRFIVESRQQY
jgi:hypothetical protein